MPVEMNWPYSAFDHYRAHVTPPGHIVGPNPFVAFSGRPVGRILTQGGFQAGG